MTAISPSCRVPPRPLTEHDDRSSFDCGRSSLNNWFQRHGLNNHVNGASRVSVIVDDNSGVIIGYVCLSASQIERSFLPKAQQRNRPDPLPAILLGQLAVHKDHQGQGHAAALLLYALKAAFTVSTSIGAIGVITHPLDDNVRAFYANYGFQDLPFDPHRAMIVRMMDLKKSGITA